MKIYKIASYTTSLMYFLMRNEQTTNQIAHNSIKQTVQCWESSLVWCDEITKEINRQSGEWIVSLES